MCQCHIQSRLAERVSISLITFSPRLRSTFSLIVNMKMARQLGMTIPAVVLLQAAKVIA
jgi:hypothetical protein